MPGLQQAFGHIHVQLPPPEELADTPGSCRCFEAFQQSERRERCRERLHGVLKQGKLSAEGPAFFKPQSSHHADAVGKRHNTGDKIVPGNRAGGKSRERKLAKTGP